LYYDTTEAIEAKVKIKAVAFSADERQVYAVGDNFSLFHFPVSLDDLITEARQRTKDAKTIVSEEVCEKYLHQPCPEALRRAP
jgi:hypothetical protein